MMALATENRRAAVPGGTATSVAAAPQCAVSRRPARGSGWRVPPACTLMPRPGNDAAGAWPRCIRPARLHLSNQHNSGKF